MTTDSNQCETLHSTYCLHADQQLPFARFRFEWERWAACQGNTLEALILVVEYLKRQRLEASEPRYRPTINLWRILANDGWFACKLDEAQSQARADAARRRIPKVHQGKQMVLRATGRMEPETKVQVKTVTPAQILPDNTQEVCQKLRAFAQSL